jgi:hypothetical protein
MYTRLCAQDFYKSDCDHYLPGDFKLPAAAPEAETLLRGSSVVVNLCASWAEPCAHLKSSMPSARLLPAALLAAGNQTPSVCTFGRLPFTVGCLLFM